jgi:uncharacterized membrane protein YukC
MEDFSQSNAKLMATALFFEYVVYTVFSIVDLVKKDSPEYIYINEKVAENMKKKAAADKAKAQKRKEENKKAKEDKKKAKEDKKNNKGKAYFIKLL